MIDMSDKRKTIDIIFQEKNSNPHKADPEKVLEFNKKILTKKYPISTGHYPSV